MKKVKLFLVFMIVFSSCKESCEEKVSKMFIIDRIKIDDMGSSIKSIEKMYREKEYGVIKAYLLTQFGSQISTVVARMNKEDIKAKEVDIFEIIDKTLSLAKRELEYNESQALRVCEYSNK